MCVGLMSSCVDDVVLPVDPEEGMEDTVDPTVPDDLLDGYTVSFTLNLGPINGNQSGLGLTRALSADYQMEIDNFIDLEKIRILFFTCDVETVTNEDGTVSYVVDNTGTKDHFLFESKSRWVSQLDNSETTDAQWQVTAPVFKYGNNDNYPWEDIRWTLQNKPFKVAVLVNRPDEVKFGNFDDMFSGPVPLDTNRGPHWSVSETWLPRERRTGAEAEMSDEEYDKTRYTINDLHHCQWDPIYSSKNNVEIDGRGPYDFIMKNWQKRLPKGSLPIPTDGVGDWNMMGAFSYWTVKENRGEGEINYYFPPTKETQGIPMYGVQRFDPIPSTWKQGTPYNVSYRPQGQQGEYFRKNVHLLRSLVKLELRIPKDIEINGEPITISQPQLRYTNVMARCEPLDVATPTEEIWKDNHAECEWQDLYTYGPLIKDNTVTDNGKLNDRMLWFYGAWKEWWDFNKFYDKNSTKFNEASGEKGIPADKFPHIFNPVVQRNQNARIDECLVEDDDYWYYVVYTGERNINDPTKMDAASNMTTANSHVAYFQFKVDQNDLTYCIFLTDYGKTNDHTGNALIKDNYLQNTEEQSSYRKAMAEDPNKMNWNWPLLRNHSYIFTVKSLGNYQDPGGIDVYVVSSENRTAPDIIYQ